jgi:lysozyme
MKTNQLGIKLLHDFENCVLTAYLCPAAIELKKQGKPVFWTIGWGNTFYANGSKVKEGDKITQSEADNLFATILKRFESDVISLLKAKVNENQFSALVSFAYNVGSDIDADTIAEGLGDSTLLKKVNKNPDDPTIATEFAKWKNAGGKPSNGLIRRRKAESDLYFKK